MFDLAGRRASKREQLRIADLMSLTPPGDRVLEIGARDCYLSRRLTGLYREVVALDLRRPEVGEPGIVPVEGDATDLSFGDGAFDTVFCTEVLEHIPPEKLARACGEIERTSSRYVVIGVPYRQDLRADRTLCRRCGAVNPPTGHLNRFDCRRLEALFPRMRIVETRLVGRGSAVTNPLSVWLYRLCGYPYGSYDQEEGCIRCGARLERPSVGPGRWTLCFVARVLNRIQFRLYGFRRPIWIHMLLEKKNT